MQIWQNRLPLKIQHGVDAKQLNWNKIWALLTRREMNCTKVMELFSTLKPETLTVKLDQRT